ncbi:T9SS type A sorting domain-containing protein [candidate division KSB1 bacterium]|nr:T9SS type A sorting domain-containing protein [candidate division KSB1 bacterium]
MCFDIIDENSAFTLTFPKKLVGMQEQPGVHVPDVFDLTPTWPNPGSSVIRWDYSMPWSTQVSATIYDILGKEVGQIFDQHQIPGRYTASFDATGLPAGVYFAMVRANGAWSAQKFTVLSRDMGNFQDVRGAAENASYQSFAPNGRVLSKGALAREYLENLESDILIGYDNANGFRVVQAGTTNVDIIQFLAKSGGSISIKGNALARFDGLPQEPVPVFAGQDTTIVIGGVYDDQPFDLDNLVLNCNNMTVQNVSYGDNALAMQVRIDGENPYIQGQYTDPLGGGQEFSLDFAVRENAFTSPHVTLPAILEDTDEDYDVLYDLASVLSVDPEGLTYRVRSSSLDVGGKVLPNTSLLQYFTVDPDCNGPATLTIEAYRDGVKVGQTTAEMEVEPQTDLNFKVKDLHDGLAIAQDYVRLLDMTDNKVAEGYTDIEGQLNIQIEESGVYKLIYHKEGYYDRQVGTVNVDSDTSITEVRLNKATFPMALLNEIARGGDYTTNPDSATGDVNRWVTPPLEIVINTNNDRSGDVENDTTAAYEWAKKLMEEEINPATVNDTYPDGFFYGVRVEKKNLPTKDYLSADIYYDGKIMIQFVTNLPAAALRQTKVNRQTGEVEAATIILQAGLSPEVYSGYVNTLLHELASVTFRTDDNSDAINTSIFSHNNGDLDYITKRDGNLIRGVYSRPTKWKANDKSL